MCGVCVCAWAIPFFYMLWIHPRHFSMCVYGGMYVSICELIWIPELDTMSSVFPLNLNILFNIIFRKDLSLIMEFTNSGRVTG